MKRAFILGCALAIGFAASATAQQAVNIPSATQPGVGSLLFRQLFTYAEYDNDPTGADREIEQYSSHTWLAYGATPKLSLMLHIPAVIRDTNHVTAGSSEHDIGLGDIHVMAKYRIFQDDTGPIDTKRLSLLGGLDLPTADLPFGAEDSVDPMFGAVYTQIAGRHGVNASLRYTIATGGHDGSIKPGDVGADLLQYDAAYLYRLWPGEFDTDSHGAWYGMIELNGLYETNGDNEIFASPGIMYEAPSWVVEASVQLPVLQDLDHRPEAEFIFTVGFRLLF